MKSLLAVLLIFCMNVAYAQDNKQELLRLKKGEFYYYYLTGDYLNAMTQLNQWRSAGVSAIDETEVAETKVMEAAMLLSLGLHEKAQDIYVDIQHKGIKVSSQAWFYLARRWFELEDYSSALESIRNIDALLLKPKLLGETQFMKAASFIALGKYKKAQLMISNMPRKSIWAGLAQHNFILAMFVGNSSGKTLALLIENATFYLPDTEEGRNLRDRIHLISALYFLQSGKNRSAEKHLKKISLTGPYTPAALLQYGWAKVEQGQYAEALQPWRELQVKFNRFDPEVMESMLGVPHVLELMNANTQALNIYETTEKRLISMRGLLTEIDNGLDENPWLEDWVAKQNNNSWGWQTDIEFILPFNNTSAVLQHLASEKKIVNQMTDYRDLSILTNYLTEKENNLRLWITLVDKRKKESEVRIVTPVLEKSSKGLRKAKVDLKAMQDYLQSSNEDVFAFPNDVEERRIDLLANTAGSIERLMNINKASRNVEIYQQRWARVKGVFLWQMNSMKARKQWEFEQQLVAMERLIRKTDTQLIETRLANQWSPAFWQGMNARVLAVLTKTRELKKLTGQLKVESKAALLVESKGFLSDLTYRVNDYLSQSRLSIARLYDEALQKSIASEEYYEEQE